MCLNACLKICTHSHTHINPCHAEYFMYYTPPNFYSFKMQHSSYKDVFTSRVENSVDPDQMASSEAS